jgi:hypothetical protein
LESKLFKRTIMTTIKRIIEDIDTLIDLHATTNNIYLANKLKRIKHDIIKNIDVEYEEIKE